MSYSSASKPDLITLTQRLRQRDLIEDVGGPAYLAKVAGFETGRKPFDLVGVAGMFFLLTAAFGLGIDLVTGLAEIGRAFMLVSMLLGWVALGAGAVWGTIDVIREPYHGLLHHKA